MWNYFIIGASTACLTFILIYSCIQINLVINYFRAKKKKKDALPSMKHWPKVTIQLPLYNEKYVAKRLIEAITKIEYPLDALEIQVLDDSTDDTAEIISETIKQFPDHPIKHIQRIDRKGYKAGALAEGMKTVTGEYIAIFDADFIPNPLFLKKTIPYFQNPEIGVVQTKWEHLNQDYSLLTKLQAFGLDAHFSVEQVGRNSKQHFINFNGTAGVWRKKCIEEAGGWESDTITEDLDLSYRAQLKDWSFLYLDDLGSPAELPVDMSAIKSQQFRWNKGAAECAKKNLFKVLKAKNIPFKTKIHAIFHLLNSSIYLMILILSVLSIPMLLFKANHPQYKDYSMISLVFSISMVFLSIFYYVSILSRDLSRRKTFTTFITQFPLFLTLSMGLSLHNAIAVFEGYIGKKSPFVRTPKFNIVEKKENWKGHIYTMKSIQFITFIELGLACYYIYGISLGIQYGEFSWFHFHSLLALGFLIVPFYSIRHLFYAK